MQKGIVVGDDGLKVGRIDMEEEWICVYGGFNGLLVGKVVGVAEWTACFWG